jgi:HEPN domain-containing protein
MSKNKGSYEPLFMSGDDWQNNACINQKVIHGLDLFAEGYKTAADILVKHVAEHSSHQDTIVYPIVFLYRQHIELRFKEVIREGLLLLDEGQDFPKTHKLDKLWSLVKEIIEKVWPGEDTEEFGLIGHVVNEFSAIDPESMSFRYPEDRCGNNPLIDLAHINLRHLAEMIDEVYNFLFGVSAAISEYRDAQFQLREAFSKACRPSTNQFGQAKRRRVV